MATIYQTLPAKHIESFLRNGHYFTPCCNFRDKTEFRYGYCYFAGADTEEESDECVRDTLTNETINQWLRTTCVSCWAKELSDSRRMWDEYGAHGPAIRISVDRERFCKNAKISLGNPASGDVTYATLISDTAPQFLDLGGFSENDPIKDLFFHKRGCFVWEKEFRIIVASGSAVYLPVDPNIIIEIALSPLSPLPPDIERSLRERFGTKVQNCSC